PLRIDDPSSATDDAPAHASLLQAENPQAASPSGSLRKHTPAHHFPHAPDPPTPPRSPPSRSSKYSNPSAASSASSLLPKKSRSLWDRRSAHVHRPDTPSAATRNSLYDPA